MRPDDNTPDGYLALQIGGDDLMLAYRKDGEWFVTSDKGEVPVDASTVTGWRKITLAEFYTLGKADGVNKNLVPKYKAGR